jgi:hypothetical protein
MICADFLAGANLERDELKSVVAACSHESEVGTGQLPDAEINRDDHEAAEASP